MGGAFIQFPILPGAENRLTWITRLNPLELQEEAPRRSWKQDYPRLPTFAIDRDLTCIVSD
jgi:hypothetical protein